MQAKIVSFGKKTKLTIVGGFVLLFAAFLFSFTTLGGTIANLMLATQPALDQGLLAHWTFDNGTAIASSTEANATYGFVRSITLEQEMVTGGSDLTNFPVLISEMRPDLRTTGNGGDVTSASGYDIIFSSNSSCSSPLDHEIERYTESTGEFVAWVRIPTLGATVDTTIYMCYGNTAITTSQEDIPGTWDSNYVGVWHMHGDASTQLDSADATQSHDATVSGATPNTTGKIGMAYGFDGVNDVLTVTDEGGLDLTNTGTFEAWMETDDVNGSEANFSSWIAQDAPNGSGTFESSAFDMVIVGENMHYGSFMCDGATETGEVASSTLSGSVFRNWFATPDTTDYPGCAIGEGAQFGVDSDGVHIYYFAVAHGTAAEAPFIATSTVDGVTFGAQVALTTESPPGSGGDEHGAVDLVLVDDNLYIAAIELTTAAETISTTTMAKGSTENPTWRSHSDTTTALAGAASQGCNIAVDSDGSHLYYVAYCHNASAAETYATASSTVGVTTPTTWRSETAPDGIGANEIGGIDIAVVGGRILHVAGFTSAGTDAFSTASSSVTSGGTLSWTARGLSSAPGTPADGDPSDVAVETDGKNVYYAGMVSDAGVEAFLLASSTLPAHPFMSKRDAYEMIQVGTGYFFDWAGKPYGFGTSTAVDTFKHVVVTQDGSTLNMYENGVLRRTQTTTVDFASNANDLLIGAGHRSVGTQIFFDGTIDEPRVSNTARSADWILTQYHNQNSTTTFYTVGAEVSGPQTTETGLHFTARDRSGNDRHASSTAGMVIETTPGRIGQAFQFNGINDRLNAGDIDGGGANVRTVSFWVKFATTTAASKPIIHLDTSDADSIELVSGLIDDVGFTATNIYVDGSTASAAISDLGWHHVVVTHASGLNADDFTMSSTTNYFGGALDDVRVYNRVLPQKEIIDLYKLGATSKINTTLNTQPVLEGDLMLHWTFDGKDYDETQVGAQARDRSGNGRHGSVIFPQSSSAGGTDSEAFTADDTWVVPAGVTTVTIKAWGGGGGGGSGDASGEPDAAGGGGGGGGFARGDASVTPSGTLTVHVGGGGGGGPTAGRGQGGGGGGFSGVSDDGGTTYLIQAGGGGGGGGANNTAGENGGGGGAGSGANGNDGLVGVDDTCDGLASLGDGGSGGTTSGGGAGGAGCSDSTDGETGSANQGGAGGGGVTTGGGGAGGTHGGGAGGVFTGSAAGGAGGGGAGQFGGGGGEAGNSEGSGGGGGGSGKTAGLSNVTTTTGTDGTTGGAGGAAANTGDADYAGSAGLGSDGTVGDVTASDGNPGRVVISWTTTGSTAAGATTTPGRIGQALTFNGQNGYVLAGDADGGGANVRTVSFWMKAATTTLNQQLINLDISDGDYIDTSSAGVVTANGFTATTVYVDGSSSSASIPDTGWHHVVVTHASGLNADDFQVGSTTDGRFGGAIDDVRVYSRVLSADDVQRLYGLGATSKVNTTIPDRTPYGSRLVGHWTFDGPHVNLGEADAEIRDQSAELNHGDWVNHASTTVPGKIGQALSFDGSNDYVDVGASSSFVRTVAFWIKTTDLTQDLIDLNGTDYIHLASGVVTATGFTGTVYVDGVQTTTYPSDGDWHHVAVTMDSQNASNLNIGRREGSTYFIGRMDDVRLYSAALTLTDIRRISRGAPPTFAGAGYGGADGEGGTIPAPTRTVNVTNNTELTNALSAALAGDHIVLDDGGSYSGFTASQSGTLAEPIVIRAETTLGAAVSGNITITGSDVWLVGIDVTGGGIVTLDGLRARLSSSRLQSSGKSVIVEDGGINVVVDHNEIDSQALCDTSNWIGFFLDPASEDNFNPHVFRNYFHDAVDLCGGDDNSAVHIGGSGTNSFARVGALLEYNLFEDWLGDAEVVSNKSSNNTYRFNTSTGSTEFVNRHGKHNNWIANWVEDSDGMRAHDLDLKYVGNRGDIRIMGGDCVGFDGAGCHSNVEDSIIAGNIGPLHLGDVFGGDTIPIRYNSIEAQNGAITLELEESNSFASSTALFVPSAFELTSADVGPNAPTAPSL